MSKPLDLTLPSISVKANSSIKIMSDLKIAPGYIMKTYTSSARVQYVEVMYNGRSYYYFEPMMFITQNMDCDVTLYPKKSAWIVRCKY